MFQQINVNMQHTPSCHKEVGDYLESLFVGSRKYTLRKLRHVVVEKGTLFEFAADKQFHQFEPNINHLEFIGTHINKDFVTFSLSSCFPTLERLTFNGCFFQIHWIQCTVSIYPCLKLPSTHFIYQTMQQNSKKIMIPLFDQ